MYSKLSIKGHATKGEEVIKLLEMLGGGKAGYSGRGSQYYYYIDNFGNIIGTTELPNDIIFKVFTLEEFLEKYPYKVHNKVRIPDYESEVRITSMRWDGYNVQYEVITDEVEWYSTEELNDFNEPRKEEAMKKEISGAIVDRFICLDGYDFYDDKGNIIDTKEITMKKKQPKCPKTYEECCKALGHVTIDEVIGYKDLLLDNFQMLLICRDAYWKIAGEQMGLGKSWKPNWSIYEHKFCLGTDKDKIIEECVTTGNRILAFPTKEMRDTFYENFKALIEECKELL